MKKQWWTDEVIQSNAKGLGEVCGFLGDYKVSVTCNGQTTVREVKLGSDGGKITLSLPAE
ncbi:MAG: hypothetical protein QNL33_07550 [Akkermansiaceae bacterium]